MLPALHGWSPYTLTPSRLELESRPFLVEPLPFLCAHSVTSRAGRDADSAGRAAVAANDNDMAGRRWHGARATHCAATPSKQRCEGDVTRTSVLHQAEVRGDHLLQRALVGLDTAAPTWMHVRWPEGRHEGAVLLAWEARATAVRIQDFILSQERKEVKLLCRWACERLHLGIPSLVITRRFPHAHAARHGLRGARATGYRPLRGALGARAAPRRRAGALRPRRCREAGWRKGCKEQGGARA